MDTEQIEDIYALSPAQQGMLFETRLAPNSGVYINQKFCEFRGELDVASFEKAWQRVLERHTALRTCFVWEGLDEPVQIVHRRLKVTLDQQDWRTLSAAEQDARLKQYLKSDRLRGFDLTAAPLMRLVLFQTAASQYKFVWTTHHLLVDGWSNELLLKDLLTFYAAYCRGDEPPFEPARPYRDYIAWLQSQDLNAAEGYWRRELKGLTAPTRLATGRAAADRGEPQAAHSEVKATLPEAATQALASFARQHKLTLNTLIQGTWALLLSQYSSQPDVLFGATVSGRPPLLPGAEAIVGMFINTLPVRLQVAGEQDLLSWLRAVQDKQSERMQYEYSPLVQVQGWSDIARGQALFESIVVFENYPVYAKAPAADAASAKKDPALVARDVQFIEMSNYPLTVVVFFREALTLRIYFDPSRFEEPAITRMLLHWQLLIDAILKDPHRPLSALPRMTEDDRRRVLVEWNRTDASYPRDKCIHELFEQQAAQTPDQVAVIFDKQEITYGDLNRRANQLANHLAGLGVQAESLVGICLERSADMVVGLLAVLKAGGAYVPIDPNHPAERMATIIDDAALHAVITCQSLGGRLPETPATVVRIDAEQAQIAGHGGDNLGRRAAAQNLAYVIYTSGSTGKPKGVMITHRGLVNYLSWCVRVYRVEQGRGALVHSPLGFDLTVTGLFAPLLCGTTVELLGEAEGVEGLSRAVLDRGGYSLVKLTPAHLDLLSGRLPETAAAECARALIIGGEALFGESLKFWQTHAAGTRLINEYGPTETVVGCCVYEAGGPETLAGAVPIGRPIANTQLYVLDESGRAVAIGAPGELNIGGAGLARGYLNDPALTAEKFVPDPFSREPGARLYRTGDVCRHRPDDDIEYLGRIDHQVKVRGYRIEPGEIEAALVSHPRVKEAVVVAREDVAADKRLVAYIVGSGTDAVSSNELRELLKKRLPDYMLPAAFIQIESLPLTPNGKVDRRRLPQPDQSRPEQSQQYTAPRTPTEVTLAQIWSQVLRLERVGVYDNFFELGGHSLLVNQVISRVREAFQIELPLRTLFEKPTIADLAANIDEAINSTKVETEKLAQLLGRVEQLTEEELEVLLHEQGMAAKVEDK